MTATSIDGVSDADTYWRYLRDHSLRVQRCTTCGQRRFPPRPACPRCRNLDADWTACSGEATLLSWVVVHHSPVAPWVHRTPYVIVLVALAEDPTVRLYGNYTGGPERLREGLPLRAVFVESDDRTLVHWSPAEPQP